MSPVSVTPRPDGVLHVTLRGDIDYTNASGVTDVIRHAVDVERPTAVRVDMGGVDFLDSSGIAVLVKAMKAAREIGAEYRVWAPRPRVLDQLRMTGLTDLFAVDGAASPSAPSADG
jgi:anti-anti-sigma factor